MSRQLSFACVPRCETSASAPATKIRPTTALINIFELIVWLFLAKTAASTLFSVEVSIETDSRQKRQVSFIRIENPHSEAHWAALCWEIYSVTQWCHERTCGESFFMPSLRRTLHFLSTATYCRTEKEELNGSLGRETRSWRRNLTAKYQSDYRHKLPAESKIPEPTHSSRWHHCTKTRYEG